MLEKKILSQLNLPYKMKPTLRTVVQTRYEYKNYDYLISPHRNQYHTSSIPSHLSQTPQILDTHPEESDEQLRDMERKKKKTYRRFTLYIRMLYHLEFLAHASGCVGLFIKKKFKKE